MPRLDNRMALEKFSDELQMVMTLHLEEVNALRQALGLPLRTPQQVRQRIRQWRLEHPRASQQGG